MEPASLLRYAIVLGSGLTLPGWLLGRVLHTRAGLAGAFLGSAALLVNLLLVLDSLGVALDLAHLSLALAVACSLLALVARLRTPARPANAAASRTVEPRAWILGLRGPAAWLLIPVGIAFLALVALPSIAPLSGWDTGFRWNFLAEEVVRTGTLKFYPPVTGEDFLHFAWCDGISPLVSGLYLWAYLGLGHAAAWATTPVVVLQSGLLFWLVGRLAARNGSPVSGALAVALLATSAVMLWAVSMGQETAMTALTLVAMAWFLERSRDESGGRWAVWAGIAAGVGALAREYGLGYFALGLLALLWWRQPWRRAVTFLATAAIVALPWYAHVWAKTGHPLYCFDLGGLFPTNPVHVEYMRICARDFNLLAHPEILASVPGLLAALAGVALLAGLAGGLARWRESAPWLLATALLFVFWWWSAGMTAGGLVYALRVLTPVIALAAVLGGRWLAGWIKPRGSWFAGVCAGLLGLHAAATATYLPLEPYPRWWQDRFQSGQTARAMSRAWTSMPRWQAIVDAAEGRKIFVPDLGLFLLFHERGGRPVTPFSPDLRFLFEGDPAFADAIARLRAAGFRFVLLSQVRDSLTEKLYAGHPFFAKLRERIPATRVTKIYSLYDLYAPAEQRAAP